MFAAAIRLRYKMPKAERPFAVGKKSNVLIWIVGGIGFIGSLLAFVLSFVMPSMFDGQISTSTWWGVLIGGTVLMIIIPFVIYAARKPSWKDPNSDFEPFQSEIEQSQSK